MRTKGVSVKSNWYPEPLLVLAAREVGDDTPHSFTFWATLSPRWFLPILIQAVCLVVSWSDFFSFFLVVSISHLNCKMGLRKKHIYPLEEFGLACMNSPRL